MAMAVYSSWLKPLGWVLGGSSRVYVSVGWFFLGLNGLAWFFVGLLVWVLLLFDVFFVRLGFACLSFFLFSD